MRGDGYWLVRWAAPLVLLLGAGAPLAEETADPLLADMGAETYRRYCASCHGVAGRGDGPAAGALRKRPADLTAIALRRDGQFPDPEIASFIDGRFTVPAHGSREMPIWGWRFGEEIPEESIREEIVRGKLLVLVEYLKSIQRTE